MYNFFKFERTERNDTAEENAPGMIVIIAIACTGVCLGIAILAAVKTAKRDIWWYINRKIRQIEKYQARKTNCRKCK